MPANKGFLMSLARVQSKKHTKAKMDDLLSFFQQFSTLLNAGTPLLLALRMSADQSESTRLSQIIQDMANKVAGGSAFHQAAGLYPKTFKSHWIQMMRTGEVTGKLGMLMNELLENIRQSEATRSKVSSALIYPAILMGVSFASMFVMLWKVVPTFAAFFKDFGSKLPAITQFVIDVSNAVQHYGLYMLAGIGGGGYLINKYIHTTEGRRNYHALLMAIPILGEIQVQSAMEKFASNMSLLLNSGTPLLDAVQTTQEVFREEPIYYDALGAVHRSLARGNNLTVALNDTGLFTVMLLGMTKIGEESGQMSPVLDRIAKYYRGRLETLVLRFTSMLEPMIVIIMGAMVCGILASIYVPMFQMASGPH